MAQGEGPEFKAQYSKKKEGRAGHQWLIIVTLKAEIRRISVGSQSSVNSSTDPILKKPI
jgi:hypothetical protein